MSFLAANLGNLIVGGGLAALVAAILHGMRKDRRNGKSACGDCAGCAGCGAPCRMAGQKKRPR